jgi:hypothetical protein
VKRAAMGIPAGLTMAGVTTLPVTAAATGVAMISRTATATIPTIGQAIDTVGTGEKLRRKNN